jgi:hypothetical protein
LGELARIKYPRAFLFLQSVNPWLTSLPAVCNGAKGLRLAIVPIVWCNAQIVEMFLRSYYFEVVMSISDRIPYAAIALHQRVAFLEHQIAELGVLRHRLMQAELRRYRLRSSRRASEKSHTRRHGR